jgi:hypothetical protein
MDLFPPGAWRLERNWFIRKGGDFVPYEKPQPIGRFVFTILLRKERLGNPRVRWAIGYKDSQNYISMDMDENYFARARVLNGKRDAEFRKEHGVRNEMAVSIALEVSAGRVVTHMSTDGREWQPLDTYSGQSPDPANGRFGFLLPGMDEIRVSNFSFQTVP